MSRLDDELRAAFRRVEPRSDFAERVIARIDQGRVNGRPAPKANLWRRLKGFLEPPLARWVTVGLATSLLVAIFAAQYRQIQEAPAEQQSAPSVAQQLPEVRADKSPPVVKEQPPRPVKDRPVKQRAGGKRDILARQRKERRHNLEAEQAKERLLLALQIASSTLNEVNKMVRGDD